MPLSLIYALFTLAILLIVFLVVNRMRGVRFAIAATVSTFLIMFAVGVAMLVLVTSSMP